MADLDRSLWTAYASSSNGTSTPEKVIDGDITTHWVSSVLEALPQSLWFDFGSAQNINYIRFRNADDVWSTWPVEIKVYTSPDGITWTQRCHAFWPETNADQTAVFAPITVRWVKFECLTAKQAPFHDPVYQINCREFNAGFDPDGAGTLSVEALTPAEGTMGTPYSEAAVSISQGIAPYTCAVQSGALPTGCSVDNAGVVSGTPSAGGAFSAVIRVTDDSGDYRDAPVSFYVFRPGATTGGATIWQIRGIGKLTYLPAESYSARVRIYHAEDYSGLGEDGFPGLFFGFIDPPVYMQQYDPPLPWDFSDVTLFQFDPTITDYSKFGVWIALANTISGTGLNVLKVYEFYLLADYTDGTRAYSRPTRAQHYDGSGAVTNDAYALDNDTATFAKLERTFFTPLGQECILRLDGFGEFGQPPTEEPPPVEGSWQWLDLWVWRVLQTFTAVGEELRFPPGYERAMRLQLAVEFARQYPGHDLSRVRKQLAQAIEAIDKANVSNSQAIEELPPPEIRSTEE